MKRILEDFDQFWSILESASHATSFPSFCQQTHVLHQNAGRPNHLAKDNSEALLFLTARHFMFAKIVPLQKRFPIDMCHIMVENLVMLTFLNNVNRDELRCRVT